VKSGVAPLADIDRHSAECCVSQVTAFREVTQVSLSASVTDKLFSDDAGRSSRLVRQ
jgi:hypothetical protein